MPIYEYVCMECESHFEELVRNGEAVNCPDCDASNVRKQLSVFATHGTAEQPSYGGDVRRRLLRRELWLRALSLDRATRPRSPAARAAVSRRGGRRSSSETATRTPT